MLSIIRGTTRFDRPCLPSKTCSAYPLLHLTRATCCPSRSNTSLCSDSLLRSVPCNGSRWQRFQSVTPPSCCLSRKESPSRHFYMTLCYHIFFCFASIFFMPPLANPIQTYRIHPHCIDRYSPQKYIPRNPISAAPPHSGQAKSCLSRRMRPASDRMTQMHRAMVPKEALSG